MSSLSILVRSVFFSTLTALIAAVVVVALAAFPARGDVVFIGSGTSSAGRPVEFKAKLLISGSNLTVTLENTSPTNSVEGADVLSSFYFDIWNGTSRPTLNYTSATGFVYQVRNGTNDLEFKYTPQTFTQVSGIASNLKAVNNGDASWQFRTLDSAFHPGLGFGLGTVGNSNLSPNGFTPAIVGPPGNTFLNFAIYKGGDIDPSGVLNNRYLVKNKATFTFSGVAGFTEANIGSTAVFGLGTGPDSVIIVPEPATITLVAAAVAAIGAAISRRTNSRSAPSRRSS
jgi:hypothetical protein